MDQHTFSFSIDGDAGCVEVYVTAPLDGTEEDFAAYAKDWLHEWYQGSRDVEIEK